MTQADENSKLRIHVPCKGMRTLSSIHKFLKEHNVSERYKLTTNRDDTDAAIIDLDEECNREEWKGYTDEFPDRHCLLISSRECSEHSGLVKQLQKPIDFEELLKFLDGAMDPGSSKPDKVLKTDKDQENTVPTTLPLAQDTNDNEGTREWLNKQLRHDAPDQYEEICGNSMDIDLNKAEDISSIQLAVDDRLLGRVIHAFNDNSWKGKSFVLTGTSGVCIYFNMELNIIKSEQRDEGLKTSCQLSFSDDDLSIIEIPPEDIGLDSLCVSSESFFWKLALWTYKGKLPEDLDLKKRIYLRCWPNFTRLHQIPNQFRITALLSMRAIGLIDAARILKIPQRHVFTLYSAAKTIGLAGPAKRNNDMLFNPPEIRMNNNRERLQKIVDDLD